MAVVLLVVLGAIGGIATWRLTENRGSSSPPASRTPGTQATSPQSSSGPTGTGGAGGTIGITLADYVDNVDRLLEHSHRVVLGLSPAVVDARGNQRDLVSDLSIVQHTIAAREGMIAQVEAWDVPTDSEAESVNSLLQAALAYSLDDDRNYLLEVEAREQGDRSTADGIEDQISSHQDAFTHPAKDEFRDAYNGLRERVGLPDLPPTYSF